MSSNNRWLAAVGVALVVAAPAFGAEDLRALRVEPLRGQSADQLRRDRYECHNWAVEQTGQTPVAAPTEDDSRDEQKSRRAERAERAITGAAIGGVLGGIVQGSRHRRHDAGDGMLAGAAIGAAVGAATGAKAEEREAPAEPESDYVRALTACLEGRGYDATMPAKSEVTARR